MKKIFSFLTISLFLFAQNALAAQEPLYANLIKDENGKYTITEITSYKNSIDLRNLSPVGFDSNVIDCSTAFFGSSKLNENAAKCQPSASEFRTKKVRLGPTMLLGLTTFGISLLLGVIKVESVFDYKSFDQAVAEALVNSGISGNRAAFVDRFTRIHDQTRLYDKALANLFRDYSDNYRVSSNAIEKTFVDRSGYFNSEDLYIEILVKVNKRKLGDIRPQPYKLPDFVSAPSDFEDDLNRYEEELKADFKLNRETFEDKFKAVTSYYDISCGPDYAKPYHLRYDCPETILADPGPQEHYTAKVIVVSKDFDDVFPIYSNENADLKVTFTKNKVLIENRTKRALKIRSITARYNDKTSTFDSAERVNPYELMPMQESDTLIPVKKLLGYEIEKAAVYKEVTKEAAKATKINFGIDIRYSLGDEALEHSLSGVKEYTLLELL